MSGPFNDGGEIVMCGKEVFFDGMNGIELQHRPCPYNGAIIGSGIFNRFIDMW
jgi:hypothetical protein